MTVRNDFLEKIVGRKKLEVEKLSAQIPLEIIRKEAAKRRDFRSLKKSLEKPAGQGVNIIAEIKRASPSKGMIRQDVDVKKQAEEYAAGGAAALSVLTEREFFLGCPDDLREARSVVEIPVLRKDFILCPWQVYETAAMGADALLLIVRALDEEVLKELYSLSRQIGLDVITEVHDKNEMDLAVRTGVDIIGINNRNLDTFVTDIRTSCTLAPFAGNAAVVSESGIKDGKDIKMLRESGIYNFLIGETLMKSGNPGESLHQIKGVGHE
ncbi:MAG: indole-3-glycerol phosphate synthase TrpC [Firmicutes bacterium]|nr:indole-3-glycerol phosphate synthase TrpC [Bacillota bacterium]